VAGEFFLTVVAEARELRLTSDEHFTVDGTLIEAWASLKSFKRNALKPRIFWNGSLTNCRRLTDLGDTRPDSWGSAAVPSRAELATPIEDRVRHSILGTCCSRPRGAWGPGTSR
jgi:hypothetical protein